MIADAARQDARSYPRLFGKYVLLSALARGGMGQLHLALTGQASVRKLCVIKQILDSLADDEFVQRFVDEAKLVVKLSHGNIVPVFESGIADGRYYLVMEYIEGKDLRAVWNQLEHTGRSCRPEVAIHLAKELCRGLSYAHSYGELELVHRDISPPNILLSYSGEVRITDFGLAASRIKLQKTSPGVLFGKLAYMSPEQARNEPVDRRADIYSVGVILWELLTGKRLFPKRGSQLDQLRRAANPRVEPPSRVKPELPAAVDLIVRRALAPKLEERYPDAESMRRDLAGLLAKIDPTTDAQAVQRMMRDLYGDRIAQERNERQAMLDRLSPEIDRLLENPEHQHRPRITSIVSASRSSVSEDDTAEAPLGGLRQAPSLGPGIELGGRYRIDELIREGGMGTVYLATHLGIERQVAVKVLHPIYGRMPDVVSRFRREAKAASRIGHPHIIEIFDSGTTDDGSIYFAMEHLAGHDLGDLLDSEGPLQIDRCLHIATQICEALAAAHEADIVHRDLKPENVFLVARENEVDFVKVLDFGIAQTKVEDSQQQRLTNPGMAMGTPEYMAPEQAAGKACDHRADIYAVGAIVYEMLAGQPPHAGSNLLEVLDRKANEPARPLTDLRGDVPDDLARVVHWTLQAEPEMRPQTMGQLGYELTKIVSGRAGAVASVLGLKALGGPGFDLGSHAPLNVTGPQPALRAAEPPAASGPRAAPATPESKPLGAHAPAAEDLLSATANLPRPESGRPRRLGVTALSLLAAVAALGLLIWRELGRDEAGSSAPATQRRAMAATGGPASAGKSAGQQQQDGARKRGAGVLQRPHRERLSTAPRGAEPARETAENAATTVPADDERDEPGGPIVATEHRDPGTSAAAHGPPPTGERHGHHRANRTDRARHHRRRHRRRARGNPRRLLRTGRRELKRGHFDKARRAFERARRARRFRRAALVGLAEVEFQLGNYHAAHAFAKVARNTRGGGLRSHLVLGNIYFKLKRYRDAIKMYRKVLAIDANHGEAKRNLKAAKRRLKH